MAEFIAEIKEEDFARVDEGTRLMIESRAFVRCRDCKYADDKTGWWLNMGRSHCKYVNWWNDPNDFCSRGVRRTDEPD